MIFGLLLSVLAVGLAYLLLDFKGWTHFYQNWAPESVYYACGHGMARLDAMPLELQRFLTGETSRFDCATLPQDGYGPPAYWARVQPALTWLSALSWTYLGVTQMALLPLLAVLSATYVSGCYAFARLFLSPGLAFLAGLVVACSSATTTMHFWLRDFSKAPFFIWAVVLLLLAIRTRRPALAGVYAALAGVITGVGTTFRIDLLILLPFGAVLLACAAIFLRQGGVRRFLPLALFVALSAGVTAPILAHFKVYKNGGSLAIQGTSEPFRNLLGLEPAGYTLAWMYSDELTLSEIAADRIAGNDAWESHGELPGHAPSDSYTAAADYLFGWADLFAADFAVQALKSAAWVTWMPATFERWANADHRFRAELPVATPVYIFAGAYIPVLFGLLGFLALVLQQFPYGRIQAILSGYFLVLLMGYGGIQFDLRHVFHLEVIGIVGLLSLSQLILNRRQIVREFLPFTIWLIITSGTIGTIYAGLVAWQNTKLKHHVSELVAGESTPIALVQTATANGSSFFEFPIPEQFRGIVEGEPDSNVPEARFVGIQSYTFAEGQRVLVSVSGEVCPPEEFQLGLIYELGPDSWMPFTTSFKYEETGSSVRQALVPVFWRATQHFKGFELPRSHAACMVLAKSINAETRLPLIFSAQIDSDGIVGATHKGFGGFDVRASYPPSMQRVFPFANDAALKNDNRLPIRPSRAFERQTLPDG